MRFEKLSTAALLALMASGCLAAGTTPDKPVGSTVPSSPPTSANPQDDVMLDKYKKGEITYLELAKYAFPEEANFLCSRLGLSRGNAVRDVAPVNFSKEDMQSPVVSPFSAVSSKPARPVKTKILMRLQKGHYIAREVKNYFMQLSTHYAAAAPTLPQIVDLLLMEKSMDELFNGMVATLSIAAAVAGMFSPVPAAVPLALNAAKVVTKLTWDSYNLAHRPPSARDKSSWAQWAVLGMDAFVDVQYAQLRQKLKTAKKAEVDAFVKTIKESRGKFRVDGEAFLDRFKFHAAQEILQRGKKYFVYRCTSAPSRCEGHGYKVATPEGDAWYTTDIEEGAYVFLKGLKAMNWDDFFLGKNGWSLKEHHFHCFAGLCNGPKWPRVKDKPKKPGKEIFKTPDQRAEPDQPGVFDAVPQMQMPSVETAGMAQSLVPVAIGKDPILKEYIKGKHDIKWLVERVLPGVDFVAYMGLQRDKAAHQMTDVAALTKKSSVASLVPAGKTVPSKEVTDYLQRVLEIAQLVKTRMLQIELHYAASNSLVRIGVTNLLTPEDHVKILRFLSFASIAVSFVPGFVGSSAVIASVLIGQIRRRTQAKPPPVNTLEQWTEWSAKEIDAVIDAHYDCIRDQILNANADQLALFQQQIEEGAFRIEAREFMQGFQSRLAQIIMANVPKYTVSRCAKYCREGHPVDGVFYKLNVPTNALKHLDSIPVNWDELFQRQGGWKDLADGGEYSCKRGVVCPVWLARQGTCQRCSGVKWTYRVRKAGIKLNGAVVDFEDLTIDKEIKKDKKRWHFERVDQNTARIAGAPEEGSAPPAVIPPAPEDTPVMREFKKGKPFSWLAEQYKLDVKRNLGMARHLVPYSLTEEFISTMQATDPQALAYFQSGIYLANTFHERIKQLQVHYAAAAATVPDLVKFFIEPGKTAQVIWILVEAMAGAASLAFAETKWMWRVVQLGKTQMVDPLFLDKKKPTQGDFRSWETWSVGQMDKAADQLYLYYEDVILSATASQINNLEQLAMAGMFVLDPQEFLRSYRTMLTQGILAAHPKYHVKKCKEKLEKCFEGVVYEGNMYKDNLKKEMRKLLRDSLQINFGDFYLGRNGWNMVRKSYSCPAITRHTCASALMLKGLCHKCASKSTIVTPEFITKREDLKKLATGESVINSIDEILANEGKEAPDTGK